MQETKDELIVEVLGGDTFHRLIPLISAAARVSEITAIQMDPNSLLDLLADRYVIHSTGYMRDSMGNVTGKAFMGFPIGLVTSGGPLPSETIVTVVGKSRVGRTVYFNDPENPEDFR